MIIATILLINSSFLLFAEGFSLVSKPYNTETKIGEHVLFTQHDNRREPVEYNLEKNRGFWYYTARFFIMAGGSFPVTFGLSTAVIVPVSANKWTTKQQMEYSLISAGSLSFSIALTDMIIDLVKHKKRNNNE